MIYQFQIDKHVISVTAKTILSARLKADKIRRKHYSDKHCMLISPLK